MITELCPFDIHAHHLHYRHLIHFKLLSVPSFTMSGESRESGYEDNWQSGKTVTECNLRMLDTEDFCDVTFLLGSEKQVVRAHRYVLVSRSCVFHAMFCGPLAEKGEVTITDIAADIFKEFLRYVYTDKASINTETVTGLMYTSRKYSLDALYDLCVKFLETSLSEDNVCQILEECHGYEELDLEQKALKILTEGGESVIKSPGFEGLCPDCLEKFLKSNTLNLKESDIFEAVVSWTKERCRKEGVSDTPENRRRLLGDMRNQKMTDVLFPESVLLQPSTTYTMCVDLAPGKYYSGVNGKKTVTSDGVQFTFSDSPLDTAGTSPRSGNIPGLIFSIPTEM
ncbi:BTB/POZ domain-containing protein 6-like isoform X2 [Haliotis cracherodii]|uniref:BTB/POZ domain-containing protein 6-like isoform X2 n=1 Tax=Haliotis cracherodii TaxID=6455 RepID=UPI0039E945CF